MPKYSIHIMSHDSHELLAECIKRIKLYTPFEYDLIITDDASEPPYQIEGATIIRLPRRSNCCALRNVGMDMAKTEWVFWLDNDTMVEEGWYVPLIGKTNDPRVGLIGSPRDSRLIRKPFIPLTQADCMCEMEFAYDYNHINGECDFITSYCILIRRAAFRPTYCYNMPTPCLDPELGAMIKSNGYKVVVSDTDCKVNHLGSGTARPGGRNYLYYLSRNFTRWFNFWASQADRIFELYKGKPVEYNHNQNEPNRAMSLGTHGDLDRDFPDIPSEHVYTEL